MAKQVLNELVVWLEQAGYPDLARMTQACLSGTAQMDEKQKQVAAGFLADELLRRLAVPDVSVQTAPLEYSLAYRNKTVVFADGMADLGTLIVPDDHDVEARLVVRYRGKAGTPPVCLDSPGIFLHSGRREYGLPLVLASGSTGIIKISLVVNGSTVSLHAGYRIISIKCRSNAVIDCGAVDRIKDRSDAVVLRVPIVPHVSTEPIHDVKAVAHDMDGSCRIDGDQLVVSFLRGTDFLAIIKERGRETSRSGRFNPDSPVFPLRLLAAGLDPIEVRCSLSLAASQATVRVNRTVIEVSSSNGIPGLVSILQDGQEVFSGWTAEASHALAGQNTDPEVRVLLDGREIFHRTLVLREQFRRDEQRRQLPVWILLALLEPGLLALGIYGIASKSTGLAILATAGFIILTIGLAISTLNRILESLRESNPFLALGLGILAFVFWPVSLTLLGILAIFRPWIEIREALSGDTTP